MSFIDAIVVVCNYCSNPTRVVKSLNLASERRLSRTGSALRNTISLASGGNADISLVDSVRVTYWHTYSAEQNSLRMTVGPVDAQTIEGFTSPLIRVVDITDPRGVQEVVGQVEKRKAKYAITVGLAGQDEYRLLAFTEDRIKRPAAIAANQPSNLRDRGNGADLVIITHRDLKESIAPLKALRQSQGLSVAVVDVEDIYDEFSFGEKSAEAMKDFLSLAGASWKKPPRFVLLVGDASLDPRNYLGLGEGDLVPTRLLDTSFMETASDDWLADNDGDGLADMAVGRLPVRTAAEARNLISKITSYETSAGADETLLVSDRNDGYDFEAANDQLRVLIPSNLRVGEIRRGRMDVTTAKMMLLEAIDRGQKIVNYVGHGNVDLWSGNLLTARDTGELKNEDRLPLFVMMTCLNGYFQDTALDSLAESLLKAERGGAVAVWASTGMTLPVEQDVMNQELYRVLFDNRSLRLGEAITRAKAKVTDIDVLRTWVLLGDPTMRLK